MRIISPKEEYFFVEDRRNGSPCMRPNAIMTGTAARSTSLYRSTFSCTRRRIIASFCGCISGQAKATSSRSMAETIGSLPLRRISAKKKCFWQEQGAYRYGRTPITEGDPHALSETRQERLRSKDQHSVREAEAPGVGAVAERSPEAGYGGPVDPRRDTSSA